MSEQSYQLREVLWMRTTSGVYTTRIYVIQQLQGWIYPTSKPKECSLENVKIKKGKVFLTNKKMNQ